MNDTPSFISKLSLRNIISSIKLGANILFEIFKKSKNNLKQKTKQNKNINSRKCWRQKVQSL
jgi:hypothetical protein